MNMLFIIEATFAKKNKDKILFMVCYNSLLLSATLFMLKYNYSK